VIQERRPCRFSFTWIFNYEGCY